MKLTSLKDISIIFITAAAFLVINGVGFYGFDDWEYSEAANQWLSMGFFLGETHWGLRHTHVLPIAASYALFGFGEFQLFLPAIIFYFLVLLVVYAFLSRFFNRKTALFSCLLLTITPVMVMIATMTRPDITEAFFVMLSAFLFWRAPNSSETGRKLFLSGIAAGLAWMTRETTVALLLVYGLLFLAGRRMDRRYYWIMAAGFTAVLACDAIYSAIMSGNPLYRYETIMSSHGAEMSKNIGGQVSLVGVGEAASSVDGNISTHWLIDPFLAILLNQEFSLVFWFGIPTGLWLCFSNKTGPIHRELIQFIALLGLVWFLTVSYGLGLREQPRYYTIPAIAAVMLIGIAYTCYGAAISRNLRTMLLVALISANLLCFYVENNNPLYEERAAISLAEKFSEPVYTDRRTAWIANRLLHIKRISAIVSDLPPPHGAIYLHNPCKMADVPCNLGNRRDKVKLLGDEKLKSTWTPIWHDDPGRKFSGILIEKMGLKRFVPQSIYYKLDYPSMPVTAYRVSDRKTRTPNVSMKDN